MADTKVFALVAIGLFLSIGAVSAMPFTVPELVDLGLLNATSVVRGTVFTPEGFTQIDGALFMVSIPSNVTGLYRGGAYTDIIETGYFVGGGF